MNALAPVRLDVVVPCYNEEEVLPETVRRLTEVMGELIRQHGVADTSRIYLVDDGSRDKTWLLIEKFAAQNPLFKGVKLSRNFGHQAAVLAGLLIAEGDAVISMDADLQEDLNAMQAMLAEFRAGKEVVYGVRRRRTTDTFLKRATAEGYYHLLKRLGVEIVFNHADYRLLGRKALTALAQFGEVNVFLRGIIPQIGFPTASVYYDRAERFAGESKYPLRKMLALAWDGVTSFSAAPLRFITGFGLAIAVISMGLSIWALWTRLFGNTAIPGWASQVVPIYFLGGLQLFATGLIGEYLAKTYLESKRRPRYFVEKTV